MFNKSLTRDELQQKIAGHFPKTFSKSMASATISNPQVVLEENDNRVGLLAEVEVKIPIIGTRKGNLGITGKPYLDPERRAVLLLSPKITQLEVPGLEEKWKEPLCKAAEVGLTSLLQAIPIIELDDKELKYRMINSVKVENGKLLVGFGL